ncbi:MAG: glycosyltransferase family 2 protein [Gemmatimonadaceae bacterium]
MSTTPAHTSPRDPAAPTVSVVIPTFRRPAELREAIESALAQSGVTVEVIVVDDSPEGSARDVVGAVGDARVLYRVNERPSGGVPAEVRNLAWPLARGRYLHFLDDDDRLLPGASAALVAALERRPGAGVAIGVVRPFGDDPEALAREREYFARGAELLRRTTSPRALARHMLFQTTPLVNSSCMIRRECVAAVGGYSPNVKYVEDVDFYLRAIRRCGFVFVDAPVVEYRVGTPSLMHSLEDLTVLRESYRTIYRNYREMFGRAEFLAQRVRALPGRLHGAFARRLGR